MDIAVGFQGSYGFLRSSQSKIAFSGSWHHVPSICDLSTGFQMLVAKEGNYPISDCIDAIKQLRADLQNLEKRGITDFDPISADTEGKWGKKWHKKSRTQFLQMPLRDPDHSAPGVLTPSEIKTVIRSIIEAVDWAIARFGKDMVALEID